MKDWQGNEILKAMKTEPTEEDFKKLHDRLRAKDPHFDLRVEYGGFLLKHVNDITDDEKLRMLEIENIINSKA